MKVYKEKQFLIFDFENGKNVKYDFATNTTIGKNGKIVKNLKSQLSGFSIDELFDCCTDLNYAKFLKWVKEKEGNISNIGTILSRVKYFKKYEQFFSAGINDIISEENIIYTIENIPKGLIKICREHNMVLSNRLIEYYREAPDAFNIPFHMELASLDDNDIKEIFEWKTWSNEKCKYLSTYNILISEYNYNAKALINYFDYCKTFEALSMSSVKTNLFDYVYMMKKISPKYDKYPRHLLTTHQIATRNYNRLKHQFDEEMFQKRIDRSMEKTFGSYSFIYPKSTQEIKDEAVAQNNCVASYIQRVIDGKCHILFLRRKAFPEESLVTIEVQNGKIVQAKQRFNDPVTQKQQEVINKWNEWYTEQKKVVATQ